MAERKKLWVFEQEPGVAKRKDQPKARPSRSCKCGHGMRACREYSKYTTGYCRVCSHAKACHKGGKKRR